eukprot:TRINITY_DN10187_c0_g1_i1.p1 TRINITY_DN10187_c0_g1~~TRINITY_DN10187_c0_g1_i1.p1  ORF type:complete len:425 (+),score=84.34 TRINITY_DN10187_c0_g1_i1:225-1499(+)
MIGVSEGYGQDEFAPPEGFDQLRMGHQYLRALYWGLQAAVAGGAENAPETQLEIAFGFFIIAMGVSLYASIIGNVGSLVSEFDSDNAEYQERLELAHQFIREHDLPERLRGRILDHFEVTKDHFVSSRKITELVEELPSALQADIALHLNHDLVEAVPLFKQAESDVISQLVQHMKPLVVTPGEYIIRYGTIGKEMYFLKSGVVVVCSGDGKYIYNVLTEGSYFGEVSLLFAQPRSASIRATTRCDLLTLTKDDFEMVVEDFPDFAATLREEAVRRMIGGVAMFQNLNAELLSKVTKVLAPMTVKQAEDIVKYGDAGTSMFFLMKGAAEVRSRDNRSIYACLREGDCFGEISLLLEQPRTANVVATANCDLFVLSKADFDAIGATSSELGDAVRQHVADTYRPRDAADSEKMARILKRKLKHSI